MIPTHKHVNRLNQSLSIYGTDTICTDIHIHTIDLWLDDLHIRIDETHIIHRYPSIRSISSIISAIGGIISIGIIGSGISAHGSQTQSLIDSNIPSISPMFMSTCTWTIR